MRILSLGLALVVVLTGCARPWHAAGPDRVAGGDAGWTAVTGSPLTARDDPVIAYVAGEVVLVGGYAGQPCPPGADCALTRPPERDGAAYSPTTGAWRRIAEAPRPLAAPALSATVGDRLYVLAARALLAWDSSDDSWRTRAVPGRGWISGLVADGKRLVLASASDERAVRPDLVFDTATQRWSTLPANPLTPSYDRVITAAPAGLVLTGSAIDDAGDPVDPSLVHAAVLAPGATQWRELPITGQLGSGPWSWTGTRLVDATLGGADGGQVNGYGRTIPYGGRLDPSTGAWAPLPDAPDELAGGWSVYAAAGELIASGGWLYDDDTATWARVPTPEYAPQQAGPAVWAGPDLFVYGGGTWHGSSFERSTTAWLLHP